MTDAAYTLQSLTGKTVLVTGASSGIGWHTALAFARQGANLAVTARRRERLEGLVKEIEALGAKAVFHAGDAADSAVAEATVALALTAFSRIDILINNAGAGNYRQLVDTSVEEYDQMMDSNMKSTFLFSRYAASPMIAQQTGTIVLISSVAGLQGTANEAVYCATKFAQVGFGQALAEELRPHGIKVEVICPGGVKTEFAVGKGRTEDYVRNSWMMDPAEFAETVVFACRQPANLRIVQMTVRHMGQPPA